MLLEFAEFGDLKTYVESKSANEHHDALLVADDFVEFLAQIAAGMEFLAINEVRLGSST